MLTAKLVVALRPIQTLATCAAILFAGLDQPYHNSHVRLIVMLAGSVPSTLLAISVSVQTIWSFFARHQYRNGARTVRWLCDFLIFLILGGTMTALLVIDDEYPPNRTPRIPYSDLWSILSGAATFLFFITWMFLAIEDVSTRKAQPLQVNSSPSERRWETTASSWVPPESRWEPMRQSEASPDLRSFYSKWGSISRPTFIPDPESHMQAASRSMLFSEPPSRWSDYSGR